MTVVTFSVDVRPRSFIYHILCTTCVYDASSHLVNYHSKRMCQIYDVKLTHLWMTVLRLSVDTHSVTPLCHMCCTTWMFIVSMWIVNGHDEQAM